MNKNRDVNCKEWTRSQVEAYSKQQDNFKLYAEVLERVIKSITKKLAPLAIVQTRPKSIASFAEKCQRKKAKYRDPCNQLTDLCGGRVIVHTADEVKAISGFIEKHFEIDEENTIDVSQRLKPTLRIHVCLHRLGRDSNQMISRKRTSCNYSARCVLSVCVYERERLCVCVCVCVCDCVCVVWRLLYLKIYINLKKNHKSGPRIEPLFAFVLSPNNIDIKLFLAL